MSKATDEQLEKQAEHEIQLRGTMLNVSIKFEVALMNIIYFSNAEQYINPKESKSLKIKNLTFGGKLERAKELLSTHHKDLIDANITLFSNLSEFLILRNRLAHCAIYWVNDETDNLEIWDVIEKDRFQFFAPINYKNIDIRLKIIDSLQKITSPLLSLENEIEVRLKKSDPHIFSLLKGVSNSDQPEQDP